MTSTNTTSTIPEIASSDVESVDPFASPILHAKIFAEVARVESTWQEWLAEPKGSYPDRVVQTLVETFDVHAKLYLDAVHTPDRVSSYLTVLRVTGAKLIENAEKRGPLRPLYDDDHLRKIATSSFHFVVNDDRLSAEQREVELQTEVERLRI